MATVLLEDREQIEIPTIHNLAEFRRWALSEDFPERGRIDYIAGKIEVDMSPEDMELSKLPSQVKSTTECSN